MYICKSKRLKALQSVAMQICVAKILGRPTDHHPCSLPSLGRTIKIESDLFWVNYALKDLQKPATIEIPLQLPCFVKSPGQGMSIKLVPVIMSSDLKGSIRGTCEIGDSGRSFNIAAARRTRRRTARHSEAGFK